MTTLRSKRKMAGLTQMELSRRSNVKQSVISDIENGVTKSPRVETMIALGNALGFDWRDFYDTPYMKADGEAV